MNTNHNEPTRVRGVASPDDDATRLAPMVAHGDAPAQDDATVVKPTQRLNEEDGAVATASQPDSVGTSSWERLADLQGEAQVSAGMVLKGRFLLEREIGRGGMGVVYLARDERKVEARDRNPYIAVKVLNDDFRQHPDSLIALQRESRRAQNLAHDNIVRVYDFDKDGAIVFMTMEYIEGTDLRGLIRERLDEGMPPDQSWPLIEGMGRALQRAHAAGIVHSDFKPGNVMVSTERIAKVFDFGIARAAKLAGEANGDHTLFDAASLGAMTPAYASLEMLRGQEPSCADDVYAFGCVVYELLAGHHPFQKQTAEQALAQGLRPAPIQALSRRQNRALQCSLAFTAQERPDMPALLDRLRPRTRRERLLPYALLGSLVLLGGAAAVGWMQVHQHRQQAYRVLERFSAQAPDRFASEEQARQGLLSLEEDDRRRLILDRSSVIESFLLARLDHYWAPARGREDYAGAQRVLALREQLKLFSPRLEARRTAVELERDRLLNTLDSLLDQAIAAGALFEEQPGNAVAILGRIRAIAPDSGLLRHAELEFKYDKAIGEAIGEGRLDDARRRLATGRKLFPQAQTLAARERELNASAATVPLALPGPVDGGAVAEAEVATRIESLRTASAAHDTGKVEDLLKRIAELKPDHPFLTTEGPQRLTDAFLGQARALCRQGRWSDAAAVVKRGLTLQDTPQLKQANERYELAVELARVAPTQPSAAEMQRLRGRMQQLQAQDNQGFQEFESDVAAAGRQRRLGAAVLLARLGNATQAWTLRGQRDPCRAAGLPGSAGTCADALGEHGQGPELVVIPRPGQASLAMMRNEISLGDLAVFCSATQECQVSRWSRNKAAASDISIGLIRKYARWLGQISGHAYRLPSDAEWLQAARAGGGEAACEVAVANRWGLLNMARGVGEWVREGDAVGVRGGTRHPGACTADGIRASDGSADRAVGARLVRELR